MYREAGQWQAALKLAEAYLPSKVQVGLVLCSSVRRCQHTWPASLTARYAALRTSNLPTMVRRRRCTRRWPRS
jgi:phosphohistidine phosphatase SixA